MVPGYGHAKLLVSLLRLPHRRGHRCWLLRRLEVRRLDMRRLHKRRLEVRKRSGACEGTKLIEVQRPSAPAIATKKLQIQGASHPQRLDQALRHHHQERAMTSTETSHRVIRKQRHRPTRPARARRARFRQKQRRVSNRKRARGQQDASKQKQPRKRKENRLLCKTKRRVSIFSTSAMKLRTSSRELPKPKGRNHSGHHEEWSSAYEARSRPPR